MVAPSSSEWRARSAALVVAAVVLTGAVVGTVAAATTTDVAVSAGSDSLEPGDETVVEVVVEDVDGGVGALNATVTLSNPAVAAVENVTLHGEPGLSTVTDREDGVELSAALADTDDSGRVTVATVVVRAENPGETAVDVTVRALGDEDGAAYTVGSIDRPTLSIAGSGSDASDGGDGSSDDQSGDTEAADGSGDGDSNDGDAASDDDGDTSSTGDQATSSDGSDDGSDEDADESDEGDGQAGDADSQSSDSQSANELGDGTGGPASGSPLPVDAVLAAGAVVVVGAAGGFVLYRFR